MTDDIQADGEEGESPGRSLNIRLIGLDDFTPTYANSLHINFDRGAFQIILSQLLPPIFTEPADATRLTEQGFVPAKVVARLIFTPLMVQEAIELLTRQLEAFNLQIASEIDGGKSVDQL